MKSFANGTRPWLSGRLAREIARQKIDVARHERPARRPLWWRFTRAKVRIDSERWKSISSRVKHQGSWLVDRSVRLSSVRSAGSACRAAVRSRSPHDYSCPNLLHCWA